MPKQFEENLVEIGGLLATLTVNAIDKKVCKSFRQPIVVPLEVQKDI